MALLEKVGLRRREAIEMVRDIARRESTGEATEADAKKLPALLTDSGMSEAGYTELLTIHRKRAEFRAEAAKLEASTKAMWRAREASRMHQKETQALLETRKNELNQLFRKQIDADSKQRKAHTAQCDLQALEVEHAELFGLSFELDAYHLTCGHGANLLNGFLSSADAEHLEVPYEIFMREQDRRRRIMDAAIVRTREIHKGELDKWASKKERNWGGQIIHADDDNPPEYVPPTWRDIVIDGLNFEPDEKAAA